MSDDKHKYRLDKTVFRQMTFEEADKHYGYWKDKSLKERWDAGCYLSMQMYGCDKYTPLDKTVFNKRKHKNGSILY
jgi:hypothetical protein